MLKRMTAFSETGLEDGVIVIEIRNSLISYIIKESSSEMQKSARFQNSEGGTEFSVEQTTVLLRKAELEMAPDVCIDL